MTEFVVLGHEEVPAPLYKPGTKLRHKGDHEQKAEVRYTYPDPTDLWDYVLLVHYRNVPSYMSSSDQEHWSHDQMRVWEEDTGE